MTSKRERKGGDRRPAADSTPTHSQTNSPQGTALPRYDDSPPARSKSDSGDGSRQTPSPNSITAPSALPQYDDRRNTTSGGQSGLPDFGDDEPGDPRKLELED